MHKSFGHAGRWIGLITLIACTKVGQLPTLACTAIIQIMKLSIWSWYIKEGWLDHVVQILTRPMELFQKLKNSLFNWGCKWTWMLNTYTSPEVPWEKLYYSFSQVLCNRISSKMAFPITQYLRKAIIWQYGSKNKTNLVRHGWEGRRPSKKRYILKSFPHCWAIKMSKISGFLKIP